MLNTVLAWVARMAVGKQLLGAVAWLHNAANGHKSEILLVVFGLVHALKVAGVLSAEQAGQIETLLGGALPVALAARASKIKDLVDSVVPEPPKA